MAQSANMNVMIATARKAGRSLAKDFREVENLQVSVTGAVDFVSRAILQAEGIIKEELVLARPTYGFKSEASGNVLGKDPISEFGQQDRLIMTDIEVLSGIQPNILISDREFPHQKC